MKSSRNPISYLVCLLRSDKLILLFMDGLWWWYQPATTGTNGRVSRGKCDCVMYALQCLAAPISCGKNVALNYTSPPLHH